MSSSPESAPERLWKDYGQQFRNLDDLTLARWMSQTLGQLQGCSWRVSHPLLGVYRLLSQMGHDRGIWLKRLVSMPSGYCEADCCRAPLLPLFTRDILESGLICQHCGETAVTFDDLPVAIQKKCKAWAADYAPVHAVAHWEDNQRKRCGNYDDEYERAAKQAERLLATAGRELAPLFLDLFPAILWEDHDECLEVRPEDIDMEN